jgi:hypothetical protein
MPLAFSSVTGTVYISQEPRPNPPTPTNKGDQPLLVGTTIKPRRRSPRRPPGKRPKPVAWLVTLVSGAPSSIELKEAVGPKTLIALSISSDGSVWTGVRIKQVTKRKGAGPGGNQRCRLSMQKGTLDGAKPMRNGPIFFARNGVRIGFVIAATPVQRVDNA